MSDKAPSDPKSSREQGNSLYKQGRLSEAKLCYEEAASLAPADPVPMSNLSAVLFELGRYDEAAEVCRQAISLTEDSSPLRDKLYLRSAKCFMHNLQPREAREALDRYGQGPARESLEEAVRATRELQGLYPDMEALRKRIFRFIPRYRPCLQDEPEYFPFGNDNAESVFDKGMFQTAKSGSSLSFLFGGIGDGRNLLATLFAMMVFCRSSGRHFKSLHCTLIDLKPAALARLLILLSLFSSETSGRGLMQNRAALSSAIQDTLCSAAYVYTGYILPPSVHQRLQDTISSLVQRMEVSSDGAIPGLEWVYIPSSTRPRILRYLQHWSRPLDVIFSTDNIRKGTKAGISRIKKFRMMRGFNRFYKPPPPGCEKDEDIFEQFAFIPPPADLNHRQEPDLARLLAPLQSDDPVSTAARDQLHEYINCKWMTNPTILDVEWEAKKYRNAIGGYSEVPGEEWTKLSDMDSGCVDMLAHVMGDFNPREGLSGVNGVIDFMSFYFLLVVQALDYLRKKANLRVEMVAGEMTDAMERLRYNCMEDMRDGDGSSEFPRHFDRIHMSNIPDYVGGLLAPLVYARPLLRNKDAHFQFNCLLNPPRFNPHERFQSEYLLMWDKRQIADHFGAELYGQHQGTKFRLPGELCIGPQYCAWKSTGQEKALPWDRLMPRPHLERWLYAHFLKICLPAKRDPEDSTAVYAPLNLTAFLRLVVHLHENGYPSHWLATVLENLTSGSIRTTVRAPRREVMDVNDVEKVYPQRQMSVAAWRAEFTTLLGIWRRLIPFGFSMAKGASVYPTEVYEYSIVFPDFRVKRALLRVPHFTLVFYKGNSSTLAGTLRETLLDDEVGHGSAKAKDIRERGVHIVTSFTYVTDTRTASFWMRRDVADMLLTSSADWQASIWRVDSWKREVADMPVHGRMVKGQCWA